MHIVYSRVPPLVNTCFSWPFLPSTKGCQLLPPWCQPHNPGRFVTCFWPIAIHCCWWISISRGNKVSRGYPFQPKKIESFKRYFLKYKTAICALRVYNIFGAPHQRNSGIQFKCQFWPLTGEGKSTEIAVSSSWDNICNSSPNLELGRTSKEARDALCSVGTKIQGRFQH